jgi:hypothetical protein
MVIGMRLKLVSVVLILLSVVVLGCLSQESAVDKYGEKVKAVVITSPSCGCCSQYSKYLEAKGFDVEMKLVNDITSVKNQYGIPVGLTSCHTTILGDYFVEGHVPIEALDKLILEKPAIDGIALPEMPAGSPGMPGVQRGDFIIYSVLDGQSAEFARVG